MYEQTYVPWFILQELQYFPILLFYCIARLAIKIHLRVMLLKCGGGRRCVNKVSIQLTDVMVKWSAAGEDYEKW